MAKNASSSVSKETRDGSKVTSTTSAWPVWSLHTSLYVGCSRSPPAYPAAVSMTPGISANRASTPQKHPAPNVARSIATVNCSFTAPVLLGWGFQSSACPAPFSLSANLRPASLSVSSPRFGASAADSILDASTSILSSTAVLKTASSIRAACISRLIDPLSSNPIWVMY